MTQRLGNAAHIAQFCFHAYSTHCIIQLSCIKQVAWFGFRSCWRYHSIHLLSTHGSVLMLLWRFNFHAHYEAVCLLQKWLSQEQLHQKLQLKLQEVQLKPVHEIQTTNFGSKPQTPKKHCSNKSALSILVACVRLFRLPYSSSAYWIWIQVNCAKWNQCARCFGLCMSTLCKHSGPHVLSTYTPQVT